MARQYWRRIRAALEAGHGGWRGVGHNVTMRALFAGLTTLDVLHGLDHVPDPTLKTTSLSHAMVAGGPATNAALAFRALDRLAGLEAEDPEGGVVLLSATGRGAASDLVRRDIDEGGVCLLDATAFAEGPADPAVSSIIEHPQGRMVASTNARLQVDPGRGQELLDAAVSGFGMPEVVMVDGHNPALAEAALRVGLDVPDPAEDPEADPFALISTKPAHLRVLDGGSWKPWFAPLLGFIDVAVVSADFCPPVMAHPEGDAVADFLRGFGITKVVRTRGAEPVQWWWDGASGEEPVPRVDAVSTLGAGDIFHGAFCWALATGRTRAREGGQGLADPSVQLALASRVAAASTTTFGTRAWRKDPEVVRAVTEHLT